jgi:putative alpha-1,2-mannosidase
MHTVKLALAGFVLLISKFQTTHAQSGANILPFVHPLIGTVNGGHVFPGASLPFSMAKAVADVNGEDQGGFASDGSNIIGFSHMHDSGTGGVSRIFLCCWWSICTNDENSVLT